MKSATKPDSKKELGTLLFESHTDNSFGQVSGAKIHSQQCAVSKKVHQSYRSFQKMIGSRAGEFWKKTGLVWI